MNTIISADGTPIAVYQRGQGPGLILVHGSSSDYSRWAAISPSLEDKFTIYAMERRGRGESGDTADYSIDKEVEDIVAVARSIPGQVMILGHSYGAICTLEAAPRITNLRRLVLYEPPIQTGAAIHPDDVTGRIQAAVTAGDREAAYTLFALEVLKRSPEDVERLRKLRSWPIYLSMVHTLPREMLEVDHYQFDADRFGNLETATLLLLGGRSPPFLAAAVRAIAAALKNSEVVTLAGQEHIAMDTAPRLFVNELVRFLTD